MASNFQRTSTDLDSILAPRQSGWPTASATGYTVGGVDLNQRYAVASAGTAASTINYKKAATDIGPTFAAIGTTTVAGSSSPTSIAGTGTGAPAPSISTSTFAQITASKGGGTYTYTWSLIGTVGNGSIVINGGFTNGTTQSSGASVTSTNVPAATTYSGTLRCAVSDGTTSTNVDVPWQNHNTSSAFTPRQDIYRGAFNSLTGFPTGITVNVPAGATHLIVNIFAPSGGGGCPTSGTTGGGGGARGSFLTTNSITVVGGDQFTVTSGLRGIGGNITASPNKTETQTTNTTINSVVQNYTTITLTNTSINGTKGGGTTSTNPGTFQSTIVQGLGSQSAITLTCPTGNGGAGSGTAGSTGGVPTAAGITLSSSSAGTAGTAGSANIGGNGGNASGSFPSTGVGYGYNPGAGHTDDTNADGGSNAGGGGSNISFSGNGQGGVGSGSIVQFNWS